MEVERADIPNHVLEHFLMTIQGYEEADAFFSCIAELRRSARTVLRTHKIELI